MNSLNFQPELVAKCILNTTPRSTIKNAMDLSTTSTLFHRIINSETFFKGLVDLVGANHFLLKGKWSCFKDRYFELRSACLFKTDDFPGAIFGDALVSEEGVEVFSFFHDICNFKLNEVSEFNQIVIPENLRIPPKLTSRDTPFVARSEKYLAINDRTDSSVYIYTPDGSECLNRFDLLGEICQLTIIDNMLYVVESGGRFYSLVVYNLEIKDCQDPLIIDLNGVCSFSLPICFGKESLIFLNSSNYDLQPFALDLSSLRQPDVDVQSLPWQAGSSVKGHFLRYFPYGNDFIEVFTKDGLVCLAKIGVSKEGVIRNVIASDIAKGNSKYGVISEFISDICFHSERLFIAYKIPEKGTSVFSYDIVTKMMKEVLLIPACDENTAFKSRFLCAGEKIYYLSMELGIWDQDVEVKSHLTTITYGKL